MIRESLDGGSAHAFVAATPTPSHGISYQRRLVTGDVSTNTDVNMVPATLPYWVKLTRTGNTFTAQRSTDGVTWVDITVTPALTFTMANDVYIGLAVTSHAADVRVLGPSSPTSRPRAVSPGRGRWRRSAWRRSTATRRRRSTWRCRTMPGRSRQSATRIQP